MKSLTPKQRMVANEVIFRDVNKNIQEFLEGESRPEKEIAFYCECASPDCLERINLTPQRYKELHESRKHFIIRPGHEYPEVEKIVSKKDGFQVVEKHFQPPSAKDIDLALKRIDTEAAGF